MQEARERDHVARRGRLHPQRRARRVLAVIGAVFALPVVFALAACSAAVAHMDTPVARRSLARIASRALAGTFAGRVEIEQVAHLDPGGASGIGARVFDPDGVQVLLVRDVSARVRVVEIVRAALGHGPLRVPVDDAQVGLVDVAVDIEPRSGELRLARAFASRTPAPAPPSARPEGPGRGVVIEAPSLTVGHVWAHGAPSAGAGVVDVELRQLRATAHVDPAGARAAVLHVEIVARSLPAPGDGVTRGILSGEVLLPAPSGRAFVASARYAGLARGVPVVLEGASDGVRVDARLDARAAAGDGLVGLFGDGIRLGDEAAAHVDVHGALPDLDGVARVTLGTRGRVDMRVRAHLDDRAPRVSAHASVRELDLSAVLPSAPRSALGFDADAELARGDGGVRGTLALDTLPSMLEGDALPVASLRGEIDGDRGHARLRVLGEVAPLEADVTLLPEAGERVAELDLRASVPELARLPGSLAVGTGRAALHVAGRVGLSTRAISARIEARASHVAVRDQHVDELRVLASVTGSLASPVVAFGARAEGVVAGGFAMPSVDARAVASVAAGGVTLRDAHVDLAKEDVHVGIGATRVRYGRASGDLVVEGGVVSGLGAPVRAELARRGASLDVALEAPAIELSRIGVLVGQPAGLSVGTLALEAAVQDGTARAVVAVALGDAGGFTARAADVSPAGDPGMASSWMGASGLVELDGDLDLARLRDLFPGAAAALSELSGRLTLRGAVRRREAWGHPDVRVHLKTRGLAFAGPVQEEHPLGGIEVTSVALYRSEGTDVEVDATTSDAGDEQEVALRVIDASSVLAALDVKASLPLARVLREGGGGALRDALAGAPFSSRLVVPERPLASFPAALRLANVTGRAGIDLEAAGTLRAPRFALVARGLGVRAPAFGGEAPADAVVRAVYDGRRADVLVSVSSDGGSARLHAVADLDAGALARGDAAALQAFRASSRLDLAGFPLQSVGVLADRRLRGRASGFVQLDGLHEDARVVGHLEVADLRAYGARYGRGVLDLDARAGMARAALRIDQPDGALTVRGTTGLAWGASLVPSLDPSRPTDARVSARAFRLSVLQPLVAGPVNGLDGRLDGEAHVALGGAGPQFEGLLTVRGGRAQITALGQELRDIGARIAFDPAGVVRVTDVVARSLSGELRADGVVRLSGLRFASAEANVRIPEKDKLDVALEGQALGQVWGSARILAQARGTTREIAVTVDVPKIAFALPASTKSGVQELAPPVKVRAGTYRSAGRFVRLPLDLEDVVTAKAKASAKPEPEDPTTLEIQVNLHEAIVERGNMARVTVEGEPRFLIGDGPSRVMGQIRVREGNVDIRGKKFEVRKGTVTFTGEPANPTVMATATWEAEDGTQVFADFVGPLKTGKVNLRSEPSRPKSEILALVLFGTADGANPTPSARGGGEDGTATKTAVGLGGGLAAQGLTEALDDLAGIQAQARVDTTQANNPRPELEVQITPRISVEVSHVLGTPPLAEPDRNYVSFAWRFRRNWSLDTTLGDRGRALFDAVWQKRY